MVNPFRRGAIEYPRLLARWDSLHEQWTFQKAFNEPAEQEAERSFQAAVRTVFALLKNSWDASIRGLASTLQPP